MVWPPAPRSRRDEAEEEAGRDAEGGEAVGLRVRLRACATEPDRAVAHLVEIETGRFGDGVAEVGEGDAAGGADARGERRTVPTRRSGAVPGGGEVHEVGVHGAERGGVDAESLGGAGTEALEDEIRASCQFMDECEALGGRQVDADALLALHHLRPPGFGEGHDGPDRVTVERLHLDHPGPEVGEQRRAERCGVQDRQLEHRDAGKRKVAGRVARDHQGRR